MDNPALIDARPYLCATQPEIPARFATIAKPVTRDEVLQEICGGFITAIASDIRADIIGHDLGICVPIDWKVQYIDHGRTLLIGVFCQEIPLGQWDGRYRGTVEWFRVVVPERIGYEPPL